MEDQVQRVKRETLRSQLFTSDMVTWRRFMATLRQITCVVLPSCTVLGNCVTGVDRTKWDDMT